MINTEGREYSIIKRVIALFGLVGWTPPIGRKVGVTKGILPHVQGAIGARMKTE